MKLYKLYAYKLVNGKKVNVKVLKTIVEKEMNSTTIRELYRKFLRSQNIDFNGIDIVNYGEIRKEND